MNDYRKAVELTVQSYRITVQGCTKTKLCRMARMARVPKMPKMSRMPRMPRN